MHHHPLIPTLLLALTLALPQPAYAGSHCVRAINWVIQKLEDQDAKRPESKAITSTALDAWLAAQPAEIRDKMRILADNITYITKTKFEAKLQAAAQKLAGVLGHQETIYIFIPESEDGFSGRSNRWVFQLITDELIKTNPRFLFQLEVINKAQFDAMEKKPEILVYIDDASYTGEQIGKRLNQVQHRDLKKFFVLVPYYTTAAEAWIRSILGDSKVNMVGGDSGPNMETVGEIVERTPSLTAAFMNRVFQAGWDETALTYFDHKVADAISILSVNGGGLVGRFFDGPVVEQKSNGNYAWKRNIKLIPDIDSTPY